MSPSKSPVWALDVLSAPAAAHPYTSTGRVSTCPGFILISLSDTFMRHTRGLTLELRNVRNISRSFQILGSTLYCSCTVWSRWPSVLTTELGGTTVLLATETLVTYGLQFTIPFVICTCSPFNPIYPWDMQNSIPFPLRKSIPSNMSSKTGATYTLVVKVCEPSFILTGPTMFLFICIPLPAVFITVSIIMGGECSNPWYNSS